MDASKYIKSSYLYNEEFDRILEFIAGCYRLMVKKYHMVENNENKIRNRLYVDFLKNNSVRKKLNCGLFDFTCEGAEIDSNYNESGYTDIRISLPITFKKTEAYYIIECKRIDGQLCLNQKYVKEGILRFTTGKYPLYKSLSGMLGFVVKKIDIGSNVSSINTCIKNENHNLRTEQLMKKTRLIKKFKHSYDSIHANYKSKNIKIHHLMLDYSSLVQINGNCNS